MFYHLNRIVSVWLIADLYRIAFDSASVSISTAVNSLVGIHREYYHHKATWTDGFGSCHGFPGVFVCQYHVVIFIWHTEWSLSPYCCKYMSKSIVSWIPWKNIANVCYYSRCMLLYSYCMLFCFVVYVSWLTEIAWPSEYDWLLITLRGLPSNH